MIQAQTDNTCKFETPIIDVVRADLRMNIKDGYSTYLDDVVTQGCQSGVVSGLIYYSDTLAFFHSHKGEISQRLCDLVEDTGCSIDELFRDWDTTDPLAGETHNQNLLAWFGYEEAARELLEVI